MSVGQTIATENPEISADMCQACAEARNAGQGSYMLSLSEIQLINACIYSVLSHT